MFSYVRKVDASRGRSILEEFCRSAGRTVGARAAELAGGFIDDDISSR